MLSDLLDRCARNPVSQGRRVMKRRFLAVDDYGMGGIWMVIAAESQQQIADKYPELTVFADPPDFLSDAEISSIERELRFDIDDEPRDYLARVVERRADER